MSIHEDYAGGSYKSNGELESDIENLSARVAALESHIEQLTELLKQYREMGPINGREVQAWELSNVFMNWLKSDEDE